MCYRLRGIVILVIETIDCIYIYKGFPVFLHRGLYICRARLEVVLLNQ